MGSFQGQQLDKSMDVAVARTIRSLKEAAVSAERSSHRLQKNATAATVAMGGAANLAGILSRFETHMPKVGGAVQQTDTVPSHC